MQIQKNLLIVVLALIATKTIGQNTSTYEDVKNAIRFQNQEAGANFISERAFNIFMQRRVSNYLTGSSDLSLFQSYVTYSSENDKLNFGFNFARKASNGRLSLLLNPMIETGIKKNFATLYKKGEWENGIRGGFKATYIFPGSINYYTDTDGGVINSTTQKGRIITKRLKILAELLLKIDEESEKYRALQSTISSELDRFRSSRQTVSINITGQEISPVDFEKKKLEYQDEFAKLEADLLDEPHAYSYSLGFWISVWGFYPLTTETLYTSPDATQIFTEKESNPWEFNIQGNMLLEGVGGVCFLNLGLRAFNNNSTLAELLTKVDYNKYLEFPGANPINLAQIESDEAYIGVYDQFVTTNVNLQVVYMAPSKGFVNAGISFRLEKNFGDYSSANLKLGFPLRFKGKEKEKPINIEPQIRWNDVSNYANKEDYTREPVIGINAGIPFTTLF